MFSVALVLFVVVVGALGITAIGEQKRGAAPSRRLALGVAQFFVFLAAVAAGLIIISIVSSLV